MEHSIWTQSVSLPSFPPVEGDIRRDVLIVGGGMAGLLCAHMLRQAGVSCLVAEAGRIGSGVTSGTTAKITSQHGWIYHKLLQKFSPETARSYWEANQEALDTFCRMAEEIPCDLERKDHYIYATEDTELPELELDALSRLDIPGEFVCVQELPFPTAGAVCFRNQAQFHPLKFLQGILPGLEIREQSRVMRVEKGVAYTDRGIIRADKIVIATHYPILNRKGLYFLKQYQSRSYVLALESAGPLKGMYLDGSGKGFSLRSQGDLLILGGAGHRTGNTSGGWAPLSAFARAYYPGAREAARWATQDCMTLDGIPYIGQYSPHTPGLYVATGFNKWGMTGSMVSALLLRDMILGKVNPRAKLFDPGRSILHRQLASNAWESTRNLLRPVRPRCPHLGCALQWNPWEHSWDCPCHGSRFSESGHILDAPTVYPMKKDRQ